MIRDSPNKNDPSNSSLEKSSKVCLELHSLKLAAHPEDQWLEDESSFWGQKAYFQGRLMAVSFTESVYPCMMGMFYLHVNLKKKGRRFLQRFIHPCRTNGSAKKKHAICRRESSLTLEHGLRRTDGYVVFMCPWWSLERPRTGSGGSPTIRGYGTPSKMARTFLAEINGGKPHPNHGWKTVLGAHPSSIPMSKYEPTNRMGK